MKTITLSVISMKGALEEFAEVYGKLERGEHVKPKYQLGFPNIEELRNFLTQKRLELLKGIRKEKPKSVYELGKITKRDLKSVNADLKILEKYGLIRLEKTKDRKKRVVPKTDYDRIQIKIDL